jgi:murein DD-endopeptidase MepM/ murein hydrolase activator NlpD
MAESFFNRTWSVADSSPPLLALSHYGADVTAGSNQVIMAALSGRVKVELTHAGTAGRVWLGFGQPAVVGHGNFLDPGDYWSEFTTQQINVWIEGTVAAQRLVGMEWGT